MMHGPRRQIDSMEAARHHERQEWEQRERHYLNQIEEWEQRDRHSQHRIEELERKLRATRVAQVQAQMATALAIKKQILDELAEARQEIEALRHIKGDYIER